MKTMRAKFKVDSVTTNEHSEVLNFSAVCGKFNEDGASEDNTFARWTPTASLSMRITNPDLRGAIKPGQVFYVDFTPANG